MNKNNFINPHKELEESVPDLKEKLQKFLDSGKYSNEEEKEKGLVEIMNEHVLSIGGGKKYKLHETDENNEQ